MESKTQIEQCMIKKCDFCSRKGKCDKEIERNSNEFRNKQKYL